MLLPALNTFQIELWVHECCTAGRRYDATKSGPELILRAFWSTKLASETKVSLKLRLMLVGELFNMKKSLLPDEDQELADDMVASDLNQIVYEAMPSDDPNAFFGLDLRTFSAHAFDYDSIKAEVVAWANDTRNHSGGLQ